VAESTAARRIRLGSEVRVRTSLVGEDLPPRFESVADGLACGELGVDSAQVIVAALAPIKLRVDADEWMTAQRHLVADAVGASGPAFTPDQTRVQATVWQTALDRDGVELRAEEAMRHRGLTRIGTRDGLVRYRMDLMPEVSGKLERALDACVSPKTAPKFLSDEDASGLEATQADERTSGQKRHDAFAALVDAAARSAELPTIGGAAPTVLVRVDLDDLESGSGAGWIDGVDEPVSMQAVAQLACAGGVQRVPMSSAGAVDLAGCARPHLHGAAATRHLRARRGMHHPWMHGAGRLVRDPSRHRAQSWWSDPHRQRSLAVLVPPSHHRDLGLEHRHAMRGALRATARMDRPARKLASGSRSTLGSDEAFSRATSRHRGRRVEARRQRGDDEWVEQPREPVEHGR
jgi:hypothetical protein